MSAVSRSRRSCRGRAITVAGGALALATALLAGSAGAAPPAPPPPDGLAPLVHRTFASRRYRFCHDPD